MFKTHNLPENGGLARRCQFLSLIVSPKRQGKSALLTI